MSARNFTLITNVIFLRSSKKYEESGWDGLDVVMIDYLRRG